MPNDYIKNDFKLGLLWVCALVAGCLVWSPPQTKNQCGPFGNKSRVMDLRRVVAHSGRRVMGQIRSTRLARASRNKFANHIKSFHFPLDFYYFLLFIPPPPGPAEKLHPACSSTPTLIPPHTFTPPCSQNTINNYESSTNQMKYKEDVISIMEIQ